MLLDREVEGLSTIPADGTDAAYMKKGTPARPAGS